MKEKRKIYYLTNAEFDVQISKGMIISMKQTGDSYQTQYADEKLGFGGICILYEDVHKNIVEFFTNDQETYQESGVVRRDNGLSYQAKSSDGTISVSISYELEYDKLSQKIQVINTSEKEITLCDVGIRQACHTEFKWGESASPNVIGHYHIGGNSSHGTYYRVDGEGPCLIFAPQEDTQLLYYDVQKWFNPELNEREQKETEEGKGFTMLYPFAVKRAERAAKKGARLRTQQHTVLLKPGETASFSFAYLWADHFLRAGKRMAQEGLIHAVSIPGYTIPQGTNVQLCLESFWGQSEVKVFCDESKEPISYVRTKECESGTKQYFYEFSFETLGEHTISIYYGKQKQAYLYYFATQPVEILWEKRAAFIASHQIKDETLWYDGLLCEWNNKTGVQLSPDNYDTIGGWRIYEVSCDDPGLAKPAFLSSKQTMLPNQDEIAALDHYLDRFVWGGLQQTEEEPYPYGIYGIPDWHVLRNSKEDGTRGKLHIWRIYDYPHIALTWYNMYLTAVRYPNLKFQLEPIVYLKRAYGTACGMFTIPSEIEDWSAYKTGLYNECVIPKIIAALRENGMKAQADRLETFWMRKVKFFVTECKDVFGSEYPFDTTGFESTFVLAEDGLKVAVFERDDSPFAESIPYEKAVQFMESQHKCNIACRGYLEPSYFCYGSDYRGNSTHYMLSYMSQMGGCSILRHALYYEKEPWEMLRLGYGSLLSSYALMNTGDEVSNYGYWFSGKEHDGAAGGGFEPLYEGKTWLDQPHSGGSWYYSCEIDLGFCGGVRGASCIVAEDPLFGRIGYGADLSKKDNIWTVKRSDAAGKEFHYLSNDKRLHVVLDHGTLAKTAAKYNESDHSLTLYFDTQKSALTGTVTISMLHMVGTLEDGTMLGSNTVQYPLKYGQESIKILLNEG